MKLKEFKCDCKKCTIINFCGEINNDRKICKNKVINKIDDEDYIYFAIDCNRKGILNNLEIEEMAENFFNKGM